MSMSFRVAAPRALTAMVLGASVLAVSGCGGASGLRRSVGLEAPPPDEFLVVARRPLEMPPSLEALPEPQPGAPSRAEPDPLRDAQAALGLSPVGAVDMAAASSRGEAALLAAAGAEATDPSIRRVVAEEAPAPERRYGLDYLFGYPVVQDPEADAETLDPAEEARRLREAGLAAPQPAAGPVED